MPQNAIRYSAHLLTSLQRANMLAIKMGHGMITCEHLLLALLDDHDTSFLLQAYEVDRKAVAQKLRDYLLDHGDPLKAQQTPQPSPQLYGVLQQAAESVRRTGLSEVESNIVLALLVENEDSVSAKVLKPYGLDFAAVIQYLRLRSDAAPETVPADHENREPTAAKAPSTLTEKPIGQPAAPTAKKSQETSQVSQAKSTPTEQGEPAVATSRPAPTKTATSSTAPKSNHNAKPKPKSKLKERLGKKHRAAKTSGIDRPAPATTIPPEPTITRPLVQDPRTRVKTLPPKSGSPNTAVTATAPDSPSTPRQPPKPPVPPSAAKQRMSQPAGQQPSSSPATPASQSRANKPTATSQTVSAKAQKSPSAPQANTTTLTAGHPAAAAPPSPPASDQPLQPPQSQPTGPITPPTMAHGTATPPPVNAVNSMPSQSASEGRRGAAAPAAPVTPASPPPHPVAPQAGPQPASAPAAPPSQQPPLPIDETESGDTLSPTGSVLEMGRLVQNIPHGLRVGDVVPVEVRIVRPPQQTLDHQAMRLSHHLLAEAITVQLRAPGRGVEIEQTSADTHWIDAHQAFIGHSDLASWQWQLRACRPGRHRVKLIVTAKTINKEGQIREARLPDTIVEIRVARNWPQTIAHVMAWLGVAALGALLGWGLPKLFNSAPLQTVLYGTGLS